MSQNIRAKRRDEILNISSNLFYKKGIENTTISEITYAANMGKGTFYKYFKNKEDVIDSYIKIYFQNMYILIYEEIDNYKTNEEKIFFIVRSLFMSKSIDEKFKYIFVEFIRVTFNKKKKESNEFYEFNQQNINLISHFIKKGIKEKEFINCDIKQIVFAIISSIFGNIVLSLSYESKECDNFIQYNTQTILNSIKYSND